jgi:hypothetical protein
MSGIGQSKVNFQLREERQLAYPTDEIPLKLESGNLNAMCLARLQEPSGPSLSSKDPAPHIIRLVAKLLGLDGLELLSELYITGITEVREAVEVVVVVVVELRERDGSRRPCSGGG